MAWLSYWLTLQPRVWMATRIRGFLLEWDDMGKPPSRGSQLGGLGTGASWDGRRQACPRFIHLKNPVKIPFLFPDLLV